jgi:hypothetical protein
MGFDPPGQLRAVQLVGHPLVRHPLLQAARGVDRIVVLVGVKVRAIATLLLTPNGRIIA